MFRGEVNLESVLARVSGSRNDCIRFQDFAAREMVVLNRIEGNSRDLLQYFDGLRTLQCQQADSVADVFNTSVESVVRSDPVKILIDVSSVDHDQEVLARVPVNQ